MISCKAVVYSRTLTEDFHLITIPESFSSEDVNWIKSCIDDCMIDFNEIMSYSPRSWIRISSWLSGELGDNETKISSLRSTIKDLQKELGEKEEAYQSDLDKLDQYKKYKDMLAVELRFSSAGNTIKMIHQGKDFIIDLPKQA